MDYTKTERSNDDVYCISLSYKKVKVSACVEPTEESSCIDEVHSLTRQFLIDLDSLKKDAQCDQPNDAPVKENVSGAVLELNDENFDQEVLRSDIPVLVDFGADWCSACQKISPTLLELASEYAGKIKVGKIDVDANPQTAQKYKIQSLPTISFFVNGTIKDQMIGAVEKWVFEQKIKSALSS